MNTVALSGTPRNAVGTKDAAQLRRERRVPCVLYGAAEPIHFSVDEAALRPVIFTPETIGVEIDINGAKTLAMVQEKQFHPVSDQVLHVDFLALDTNKETTATLNVRLVGQPAGVRKGGKLSNPIRRVRVKGKPAHIPGMMEINIADLDVNQTITLADLKIEGLTMVGRPQDVVAAVRMAKKKEDPATAAKDAKAAPAKAAPAKAAPAKK